MYVHQQTKLAPTFILLLLAEALDCAPYDRTPNKLTLVYRYGTLYSREENTQFGYPVKPPFSTPFDVYDVAGISKQTPSSTPSNSPQFTSSSGGKTKQGLIDEQILFKNGYTHKTNELEKPSQIENIDFTTDSSLGNTASDNSTSFDDDYRFGGGIAAQHAALSLIGR